MADQKHSIYGTMRVGSAQIGIEIDQLAEVVGPIKTLSPIMMNSESLLGGLDLRGDLIPILDPSSICGAGPALRDPRFAVILRYEGQLLGIGIDEITGLAQIGTDDIRTFDRMAEYDDENIVVGGFLKDGDVITVLDVPNVFKAVDTLSVRSRSSDKDSNRHETVYHQMLTFCAGGAQFSVLAVEVYGTVPRQQITQGSMTGGSCLGTIVYHGRRIPVMCTVSVLGIGRQEDYREAEVVVLRFPDDRLVGFAVETIKTIEAVDPNAFVEPPSIVNLAGSMLSRVRVDDEQSQIYALDIDAIRSDPALLAMADLSDRPPSDEGTGSEEEQADAVRQHERYLLFDAGEAMATPLSQVVKILPRPKELTPLFNSRAGLLGLFSHQGHSIPLVCLSDKPAQHHDDHDMDRRVLLVGCEGRQVGFDVDRVRSIEVSAWKHDYETGESAEVGSLVQLRKGEQSVVVECIDLIDRASEHIQ